MLDFGDVGWVGIGWDSQLCVCVEDGDICICYDKGGDFVLWLLFGGQLLGLDMWICFQVFVLIGEGVSICSLLKYYMVLLLLQDCLQVLVSGGVEVCCVQGKLQGCNIFGNCFVLFG